jgi:membrane-associated protease RseP (regulator of RpoE activity)
MIPIAAAAEFIGIDIALLLSAVLLVVSMAVIGWWFPELKRIDKGHDGDAAPAATGAPDTAVPAAPKSVAPP